MEASREPLSAMTTSPAMPVRAKKAMALPTQMATVRSSFRQGITTESRGWTRAGWCTAAVGGDDWGTAAGLMANPSGGRTASAKDMMGADPDMGMAGC